jgi:cell division protein FtsQ
MMDNGRQEQDSRSDILRRQRALKEAEHLNQVGRRAAHNLNNSAPVKHGFNLFQRKPKKSKQADDFRSSPFANKSDQITAEQPIGKRIKLSWRILSGSLTMILLACVLVAWRSPDFQVGAIDVNGMQRISQDEVLKQLDIKSRPLFTIIPEEIVQIINNAFPEFKDVKVDVNLPNHVSVTVTERQPLIAWQLEKRTLWADEDGFLFPARGQGLPMLTIQSFVLPDFYYPQTDDQPVVLIEKAFPKRNDWKKTSDSISWFEYHRHMDPALRTAIQRLAAQIPNVKVFLYDVQRGLGWNDARGWKVFVGFDLDRINEKWLMYEKIVDELIKQGVHPTLVSVEYLHAPYYRVD